MNTVTLTDLQLQECFNALLERKYRLARELDFPDLKADERAELEEALQGTREALDVLQRGVLS